jgi:hypothetical protein
MIISLFTKYLNALGPIDFLLDPFVFLHDIFVNYILTGQIPAFSAQSQLYRIGWIHFLLVSLWNENWILLTHSVPGVIQSPNPPDLRIYSSSTV